ncbi:MAG: hopanoid biosynthesis protein HpnM [Rhodospirillaceae bacterium]|nr:hopanoid biosynthesis protein HpnM [Rhodospirillaceae bacterium]
MPLTIPRFARPFLCLLLFLTITNLGVSSQAAEPRQVVESFHAALLVVMKTAEKNSVEQRYKELEPVIADAFNLDFMIRIAVGSRWKKTSNPEKTALVQAFKRMSVGTYAARFNGYSGESFKTLNVSDGPRKTKLVKTHIARAENTPVKLTYVMRQFGHDWQIIDVLLDGSISEMAVRVSEYRNILRNQGAGALATALNKIADRLISP